GGFGRSRDGGEARLLFLDDFRDDFFPGLFGGFGFPAFTARHVRSPSSPRGPGPSSGSRGRLARTVPPAPGTGSGRRRRTPETACGQGIPPCSGPAGAAREGGPGAAETRSPETPPRRTRRGSGR